MSYLSGEPVPPGFEEEMSRTAIIQKQIESYNEGPLIGTEYVVELHEDGQVRPDYFCVLCNTCNDRRSIFIHWTSVTHRTNYLKTHFQKAFEYLQQLRRTSNNSNEVVLNATTKLVQAIEKHYGRSVQILAVAGEDFRRFRAKICSQVRDKFHFDECAGPDFLDQVRNTLIESKPAVGLKVTLNLKERNMDSQTIALDAISSDDDDTNFQPLTVQHPFAKKTRKKQPEEQQPAYRAVNRSPPMADKVAKTVVPVGVKQTLPTPKELSIQAAHIAQERYKWEKFRCLLELQLKQLRDETETYESNPEKHPDYSEEWKLFWNTRYKQLQEEKKCDPNSYDYKPEWISYWKDRRVELFNIAVNKIKKELQEKFKLGDDDEENTKELMERYKIRVHSPKTTTGPNSNAGVGAAVRRKPNYRGPNNRAENGAPGSDAVIDISDDEQPPAPPSSNRPNRRPPYGRSLSRSESPKRVRAQSSRLGRRSRTRSPLPSRRRGRSRSRSRSRSPHRRSSRSPFSRNRDRSHHSRSRDDYGDRDRERDRERGRERSAGDYYRDRDDSYPRSSRTYESMETFRVLDSRNYPEYSQPRQRTNSPTGTAVSAADKDQGTLEEPEAPLTVVTVLRMLSALEDHLGSLGPKVLNLLSKALAMEKIKPNAADDLLLNEDNCVFMETIKEKLKGILIAEVLDDQQKVRVVKKLISNIATVIFQVTSKGAKEPALNDPKHGEFDRKKEYQLPFDRQLVSSKLASALIMNGLDDVSTDDMNRLIHFFTLLVKTNHGRRQSGGLNFTEVPYQLGLSSSSSLTDVDFASGSGIANDIDIDLRELMKEVTQQLAAGIDGSSKASVNDSSSTGMESLTDSDLQTLLQNFKFLSNEEQVHLIGHLRKLERLEPARVESLRKYVNIAELNSDGGESCSDYLSRIIAIGQRGISGNDRAAGSRNVAATMSAGRRKSMERELATAPKLPCRSGMRNSPTFMLDDDDDDDYNFDDLVMKANDSNGQNPSSSSSSSMLGGKSLPIVPMQSSPNALTFKPAPPKISLKDTENIIANLMGTLTNNSNHQASHAAKSQQQHQQQHQMQQRGQQQQFGSNNGGNGGGRFFNYGGDPYQQQQQQQQQQQPPYNNNMGNFNSFGPPMGHAGYGNQMNPWANNGPPQNFMQQQQHHHQQQQQTPPAPHYNNNNNNMFAGHQ
ncbi:hypothetical protein ACLKA6_018601 [Drosophila palustris]